MDWCSIYMNRHLGSGGRISQMFYVKWNRQLFPPSVFQVMIFFGDAVGKAIWYFQSALEKQPPTNKTQVYSFISALPDGKCEKLSYFGSYLVITVRQKRRKCVILQTHTFKINNWAYWCIQNTAYVGDKAQAPPTSRLEWVCSSEDPCFALLVMSRNEFKWESID